MEYDTVIDKDFELRVKGPVFTAPERTGERYDIYMLRMVNAFEDWVRAQRIEIVPRTPTPPRRSFVAIYQSPSGHEYYGREAAEKYIEDRRNGLVF